MKRIDGYRCHGGDQLRFEHTSKVLGCTMKLSVYLPPAAKLAPVPALYWLSGLTCNDQNFSQKSMAQAAAAKAGIALIIPDTSPRGDGVPDDPEGAYDFGLGASYYLNAMQDPWREHYQMEDYIVDELPELIEANLPVTDVRSIAGHSMGGHGALVLGLNYQERFRSISAFSPISSPTRCPWGVKAFERFLGSDKAAWTKYDASLLIEKGGVYRPIRVDQGLNDEFLSDQLKPEFLEAAAKSSGAPLKLHRHEGYDHSYYFVQSFMADHVAFHAEQLKD